jgi:hypothetical protein
MKLAPHPSDRLARDGPAGLGSLLGEVVEDVLRGGPGPHGLGLMAWPNDQTRQAWYEGPLCRPYREQPTSLTPRLYGPASTDNKLITESWGRVGMRGDDRGRRVAIRITDGDGEGRAGTIGDAAGKAVNRKVHGSNPCSGANREFRSDNGIFQSADTVVVN